MKPSMLGLLIAAGAFGASTVYLAIQLDEERDRADEVAELTRKLNGRIAELESMQVEMEALRATGGPPAPDAASAEADNSAATLPALADPATAAGVVPAERFDRPGGPPERSEAMQRMVRTQLRANFKRIHSDIGEKLGLTPEEANQLIDLMVDQQLAMAGRGRRNATASAEQAEKNLAEVTELIGAGRIDEYKAYQQTVPARHEVEQLSRQLEANDVALTKDQRDRMITALAEERQRVPQPNLAESVSREEYSRAMAAWQDDYNQRTATRASSILNTEQRETYGAYQQMNKEMRQQFESRRAAREARREAGAQGAR